MAEKWIQGAIKRPGALHEKLHVPKGQKIPAKKLAKAEHSRNPTERKEANLAATLKGLSHGGAKKPAHNPARQFAPGKTASVKTDRGEFRFKRNRAGD